MDLDAKRISRRNVLVGSGGALGVLALAACGAVPVQTAATEEQAEAPQAEAAAPEKESVYVLFATHPYFKFQDEEGVSAELVAEFRAEHPDIDFDVNPPSSNSGERYAAFRTAFAANTPHDISSWGEWHAIEHGALGQARGLNDLVKSSNIDMEDIWESLTENMVWSKDGQLYGFPYGPDLRVIYMHNGIFLENGLDPENGPATWDELEAVIQKTLRKDSAGNVVVAGFPPEWGSGGRFQWITPFLQLGGQRVSDDLTKAAINSPEAVEALTWVKKLNEMQGGWDALATLHKTARPSGSPRGAALVNDFTASMYATYSTRKAEIYPIDPDFGFSIIEHPKPPNAVRQASWSGHHIWIMASWTTVPEEAFAWIEFVSRPENNIRWAKAWDRVPIRLSVANSPNFTEGDPFLEHQSYQIPFRASHSLPIPGADEMRTSLSRFLPDVMAGNITIQEGLANVEQEWNIIIEKWQELVGGW